MKTTFNILLFFLLFGFTYAQSKPTFSVVGNAINKENITKGKRLDVSKIKVENISSKPIFLVWETVYNSFPKEWDCSMCQHGACQIGIPKGSVFNKLNADQQGYIAIHVIPAQKTGKGVVKFKIYDKANPTYSEILTFEVEVL